MMIHSSVPTHYQGSAQAGEVIEEASLITRRNGKMYTAKKGDAVYGWSIAYHHESNMVRFQRRGASVVQLVEVAGDVHDGDYIYPSDDGKVQAESEGQLPIGIAESSAKGGCIDALLF